MNFIDWMNMNMIVDIAFLVFAGAVVWKFHKIEKKINSLDEDISLTIKNPRAARRKRNLKTKQ